MSLEKQVYKLFAQLSRIRGSDSFGVSISNSTKDFIYKINTDPKKAVNRNEYKNFLKEGVVSLDDKNNFLSVLGQTRLVTNGTKFLYANNQPIITKNIIGVHNGILVNYKYLETDKTIKISKS